MDAYDIIAAALVLGYAAAAVFIIALCRTSKADPADRRPPQ